jgi:hypothetical protein
MGTDVPMEPAAFIVTKEAPRAAVYRLGSNVQVIRTATVSLVEAFLLLIKFKIVL